MTISRTYKVLFAAVFSLSLVLRLGLVAFNREANDPHVDVADRILRYHSLPVVGDCWECFQPKLYHLTFAVVLEVLKLTHIPPYRQNIVGELINFVAGAITLLFVLKLILRLPVRQTRLKLIAFALVALNPVLIGINSQATNDTFAILFSTLAIYYTVNYLQKPKPGTFLLILLFIVLGISSKINALVTGIAIPLTLLIKAWTKKEERAQTLLLTLLLITGIAGLSLINPLDQFIITYKKSGLPFVNGIPRQPLPHLFEQTIAAKPGILSIEDGFFTFKFLELLKHPRIELGPQAYPPFRTSFWTMLYGMAHSIHFDNWPPTWSTSGNELFFLSRGIFVLALFPTALLLIGATVEIYLVLKSIIKRDLVLAGETYFGLFAIVFIGYVLLAIFHALLYRDFFVMKAIFVYPALLSFPVLFTRAGEKLYAFFSRQKHWWMLAFEAVIDALLLLYTIDVATLIGQLVQIYLHSRAA